MTITVHEDAVPRVRTRTRRSVLRLRQPEMASAVASAVLLYTTGLMGMVLAATVLAGEDAATAATLAVPAAVSAIATALAMGGTLRRLKERSQTNMALRAALIWAFFGALGPLLQIIPAITHGDVITLGQFAESLSALTVDAFAGAAAGGIGGLCGAAAALALCVERIRFR